jgi:hypothetical protein
LRFGRAPAAQQRARRVTCPQDLLARCARPFARLHAARSDTVSDCAVVFERAEEMAKLGRSLPDPVASTETIHTA